MSENDEKISKNIQLNRVNKDFMKYIVMILSYMM